MAEQKKLWPLPEKKKCTRCKEPKSLDEFHREKANQDGRQNHCKDCNGKLARRWREANPERHIANARKWQRENPDRAKAINKRVYAEMSWERRRNKMLKHHHGITLDDYNEMLAAQRDRCAMCGEALEETVRAHHVDHDHSLGGPESVRGIVHHRCNLLIAHVENESELLRKAKTYILEWRSRKMRREAVEGADDG